jgi:hypothetical protein
LTSLFPVLHTCYRTYFPTLKIKSPQLEIFSGGTVPFWEELEAVRLASSSRVPPPYSQDDEKKIVELKLEGKTDKEIAEILGRSYWGIVDKIRRMRKNGFRI